MESFIEKNNIITDKKNLFRKKRSNDDAVNLLLKNVHEQINNGQNVLAVTLNLAKIFNSIYHKTQLNKLERYGFRGLAHNLLESYLHNVKESK